MPQYYSLMRDNVLDTFVNHGNRDGIGLDIDWQRTDEPSSNEFDLITDAILQLERKLGGGIGVGTGLWDADRDTGIQVEETADDDIIRFDTAGVERATIGAAGIFSFQEYLSHLGDADTYLRFTPDRLRVEVGGADILDIIPGAVVWNEAEADIDFKIGASGIDAALFVQGSDGAVTLGGPLLTLTGGQIAFPAGQVASADANTLDDYEEGTWTAELRGGGSPANVPVTITALYTKIGDVVKVQGGFANRDTTGAVGQLQIIGLPFTINATMPGAWVFGNHEKIAFAAGSHPTGYFNAADTKLVGYQQSAAGVGANWNVSAVAGTYFYFCAIYKV